MSFLKELSESELQALKDLTQHAYKHLGVMQDVLQKQDPSFSFYSLYMKVNEYIYNSNCSANNALADLDLRMSATHNLKCDPEYFQAVLDGHKQFEVRFNDRNYCLGDYINLLEFDRNTQTYSGRELKRLKIAYILRDYPALQEGYLVLGFGTGLLGVEIIEN